MKPIYECLDFLLKHLHDNRFKPEGQRAPFDVDSIVMPKLGLQTHEEFKGLINMLWEDQCAFFLDIGPRDLDVYKSRVMITPKGIELLNNGGYTQKNKDKLIELKANEDRDQRMEENEKELAKWTENLANRTKDLTNWTKVVGIGAVGLVVWEMIRDLFLPHK